MAGVTTASHKLDGGLSQLASLRELGPGFDFSMVLTMASLLKLKFGR
jgi:hypothetical protein